MSLSLNITKTFDKVRYNIGKVKGVSTYEKDMQVFLYDSGVNSYNECY